MIWDTLVEGEIELCEVAEVLRRQVHPMYIEEDGSISYLAFNPQSRDARKLSVRREALSAEACFNLHAEAGLRTAGTYGVSVGEVQSSERRAVDDSALEGSPEYHAYVDFRGLGKPFVREIAARLTRAAIVRGRLYGP